MKVLIGARRNSKTESYDVEDISELRLSLLRALGRRQGLRFQVAVEVLLLDDRTPLTPTQEAQIHAVDCAILETSEDDERIAYLLGRLTERDVPLLLLRSRRASSLGAGRVVPSEAKVTLYDTLSREQSDFAFIEEFLDAIEEDRKLGRSHLERLVSKVWFGQRGEEIHVICPPSYDNLASTSRMSPNYIHLDKFGDKDAFLEIAMFLSRVYGSRVIPYTPEEFPARQLLRDNLIVIGGPGLGDPDDGNPIAREVMRRVELGVSYGETPLGLKIQGSDGEFLPNFGRRGELIGDVGYFARFPSPFNPDHTVILIQGLHTAGVLGAAQSLTDTRSAAKNFEVLEKKFVTDEPWYFGVPMRVDMLGDEVLVPEFRETDIRAVRT